MRKPPGIETGSTRTVKILSVSPNDADHSAFCKILQERRASLETNCNWMVQPADSLPSAAEALKEQEITIVISEENLFAGTWQTILEYISRLPDPPLFILASRLADERLWAEALNLGAWDVLAKPFDTQEVTRVVMSAWRHWQGCHELRMQRSGTAAGE